MHELWDFLDQNKKKQFFYLVFLLFISSTLDIISIGAVVPFVSALLINKNMPIVNEYIGYIGVSAENYNLVITVFFILITIVSTIFKVTTIILTNRFSNSVGVFLANKILRNVLYDSYTNHLNQSKNEITSTLNIKITNVVYSSIMPMIGVLSSLIFLFSITVILLYLYTKVTIIVVVSVIFFYYIYLYFYKKEIRKYSSRVNNQITNLNRILNEALGNFRDIYINKSQSIYLNEYDFAVRELRRSQGNLKNIAHFPKFIIECIGICSLSILALMMSNYESNSFIDSIPYIAVFAFALQKLLPTFQQIFSSIASIRGDRYSIMEVLQYLRTNKSTAVHEKIIPVGFSDEIQIDGLAFRYPNKTQLILDSVTFSIKKGERIGIIGSTGSGKTTLTNLLIGLIEPTFGSIRVDGIKLTAENLSGWRENVALVPQDIFLSNTTYYENIAMKPDLNDVEKRWVEEAAKRAQIFDFINMQENKFHTKILESGKDLSGGQRQRIGIARALYRNAVLLVLDEATSALDLETESKILHSIDMLGDTVTIISIAHRISALEMCDHIYKIKNQKLIKV